MDYEEMLLQITDILKAHNRHHMSLPDHKQAIEQIKNVIFPDIRKDKKEAYEAGYAEASKIALSRIEEQPKGKWVFHNDYNESIRYGCNICGSLTNRNSKFCPTCGARMER